MISSWVTNRRSCRRATFTTSSRRSKDIRTVVGFCASVVTRTIRAPNWRHGGYKGDLVVEREDIDLAATDMGSPENWHIQALSHVTLTLPGEAPVQGLGVFEQLIAGPYRPYGL